MRKMMFSIFMMIIICLCGCGRETSEKVVTEASAVVTETITLAPEKEPTPTCTMTPTPIPTATPTPIPPDIEAPKLTVEGEDYTKITARTEFTGFKYSAEDNYDGDITEQVQVTGKVDVNLCGTYLLHYKISDKAGNTTQADRTIEVIHPEIITPDDKVIYLTFDDGPGYYTEKILELLDKYDIKATFFVCDTGRPEMIKNAFNAGHSIGAHCKLHEYKTIYASEEAYFEDLNAIMDIIHENTGAYTTLIRFPGGSSNSASSFNPGIMTRLTEQVEKMGYSYFDWNVSAGDATTNANTTNIKKSLKEGISSHQCSIVLMHAENKKLSYDALEEIIIWALDNDYTFLPLDSTSPSAHHKVKN